MSWRFLFALLLVAAGAATWGGLRLGDWLVAHAPQAMAAHGQGNSDDTQQVVLDANGQPYTAQPPQPRVDGTQGVPNPPANVEWTVQTASLFDTIVDPAIQASRGSVTPEEARQFAAAADALSSGSSDVATLDLGAAAPAPASAAPGAPGLTQAPLTASAPPATVSTQHAMPANWQDALRQELSQCASMGFFERPTCAWNARYKYCGPNRGWGTISECPNRQ